MKIQAVDFSENNSYNKGKIKMKQVGQMETWDEFKNWAEDIALIHSVKILVDLGKSKEEIEKEFNLTDCQFKEIIYRIKNES